VRLALFADIHANREAFAGCLADARSRGHDRVVLLGDIVGYGADPEWCADEAAQLVERGAIAVRGNHDQAIEIPDSAMSADALAAIEWTRRRLDTHRVAFLAHRPLRATLDDMLFVHANAWAPEDWGYVRGPVEAERSLRRCDERLSFCGHTHVPALYHMSPDKPPSRFTPVPGKEIPLSASRRWLAVIGSVGQPRDGNWAACYALLDTSPLRLTLHRVPYDADAAARKIRAAGLPERLAARLLIGR
jgi:diadenosine tetraphosphatase ApaH/serine/threonine PP2A family protein phosphatase